MGTGEIQFDDGRGCIWTQHGQRLGSILEEVAAKLAPARCFAYEWTDYWVRHSEAENLWVGDRWAEVVEDGLFRVRFENRVGLAWLQPFAQDRPVGEALPLEVLSLKFPTLEAHYSFLSVLLEDLFARATQLPFALSAPTGRGVAESLRSPTPLFTLHYLLRYASEIRSAWNFVVSSPHRLLVDNPKMVPLAEATEIDADVLLSALRSQDNWVRARGFPLAEALQGYAPAKVWQRQPEETLDTPENRFVMAFMRAVLSAAELLPDQSWWADVSQDRQEAIRETTTLLRHATAHPSFAEIGPMRRYPRTSRVLMRREGYRQMLALWQLFRQARRPFFGLLQHAMDVRDVATLYEVWVFFALVEGISEALRQEPALELTTSDEVGLSWRAEARFGPLGRLSYNKLLRSYSVPLRPDFIWRNEGEPAVVLDAKFRLDRQVLDEQTDDLPEATARRADLYKMHTYRDALGARAAVSIYPGDDSVFYDQATGGYRDFGLSDLLLADYSGIGAIAMRPGSFSERISDGEL